MKYCNLKAYSRKIVVLNGGVTFIKPISKPFYIQLILNYKYGTIFRQIIDSHQQEWCGIMSGADKHEWIAYIIEILSKSAPGLFHNCPYEGELDLRNVTINPESYGQKARIFPQGTYRLDVIVYRNQTQNEAVKVSVNLEIKSMLKESFG